MTVSYGLVVRLSRMAALIGFLVVFVPLAWIAGPTVEERIAPVLQSQASGVVDVSGRRVCWPIRQHKLREGSPDYVSYFVTFGTSRVAVTPYIEGTGELVATPGFHRHPPGDVWLTRYCVDLPPPVMSVTNKAIEGTIFYRVWHELWLVPASQPRVTI